MRCVYMYTGLRWPIWGLIRLSFKKKAWISVDSTTWVWISKISWLFGCFKSIIFLWHHQALPCFRIESQINNLLTRWNLTLPPRWRVTGRENVEILSSEASGACSSFERIRFMQAEYLHDWRRVDLKDLFAWGRKGWAAVKLRNWTTMISYIFNCKISDR